MSPVIIRAVPILLLLAACGQPAAKKEPAEEAIAARTPVTFTAPETGALKDILDLNATAAFQKKDVVKAEISGYVIQANVNPGDVVTQGQELFVIQTRESAAFQDQSKLDSALRFSGILHARAPMSGIVTDLGRLKGDYAQEGDQLCVLADRNSFVFLVNVPFTERQTVRPGARCMIVLPDNSTIPGIVTTSMPTVDPAAQTEVFVVKPQQHVVLPENLIARIQFVRRSIAKAQILPKEAVLTNETQQRYWVMKLVNDSLVVRVPVTKGMENGHSVEILTPVFLPSDRILLTGNYGLPDTASVTIDNK